MNLNIDDLTARALRALCDQIGAGRIRRENLRPAFAGILADLASVDVSTINTAFTFMPPVILDALMARVDALWATCNKAGVKPPRQVIDEALTATCTMLAASAEQGDAVPSFVLLPFLHVRVAEAAGIPARNGPAYWDENATAEDRARLADCQAGSGQSKKSIFPWLLGAGVLLKVLL